MSVAAASFGLSFTIVRTAAAATEECGTFSIRRSASRARYATSGSESFSAVFSGPIAAEPNFSTSSVAFCRSSNSSAANFLITSPILF